MVSTASPVLHIAERILVNRGEYVGGVLAPILTFVFTRRLGPRVAGLWHPVVRSATSGVTTHRSVLAF
jgi:hypothetical protein